MCFLYDDSPEFAESNVVKTRKPHKCEACRKTFPAKSVMTCHSGLFDHRFYRFYACNRCQRLQYAIVVNEINEGCDWSTAWIAFDELKWYLEDIEHEGLVPLGMPTLDDCFRYVNDLWMTRTGYARPDETSQLRRMDV